jgi:hypothetical protein
VRWQHFDELEADFQQYYNLDVRTVMPARAARLMFQLPRSCRVFVALAPSNQWGWSEMLLNKANYALEVLAWQNANEGKKQHEQTEKPVPFEPDFMKTKTTDPELASYDIEEMKELLARPRE